MCYQQPVWTYLVHCKLCSTVNRHLFGPLTSTETHGAMLSLISVQHQYRLRHPRKLFFLATPRTDNVTRFPYSMPTYRSYGGVSLLATPPTDNVTRCPSGTPNARRRGRMSLLAPLPTVTNPPLQFTWQGVLLGKPAQSSAVASEGLFALLFFFFFFFLAAFSASSLALLSAKARSAASCSDPKHMIMPGPVHSVATEVYDCCKKRRRRVLDMCLPRQQKNCHKPQAQNKFSLNMHTRVYSKACK